ncbi:uncharacterized protein [Amphiura filiformis]|uniref:uncharacterized protein isoform X2 n=1 Tax=Amphiura filiformis TaxID=82378 RepID=UPI003B211D9C
MKLAFGLLLLLSFACNIEAWLIRDSYSGDSSSGDDPTIFGLPNDIDQDDARGVAIIVNTGEVGSGAGPEDSEYSSEISATCLKQDGSRRVQNSDFQYPFPQLPVGTKRFTFSVKGGNNAYILLSPTNNGLPNDKDQDDAHGLPQIVIGGWNNQESALLCNSNDGWKRFPSPHVLSAFEAREFFVQFLPGTNYLQVGRVGHPPFLSTPYCSENVKYMKYVGIASGLGSSNTQWKFCSQVNTGEVSSGAGPEDSEHISETTETCIKHDVLSYGSRRVQNSDFQYPFPQLPAGTERFTFSVKGRNDAYIILSPTNSGLSNDRDKDNARGITKIVIGGWNNQESALLCNSNVDWKRFPSPNVLSAFEAREFFVQFLPGTNCLQVGRVGQPPFMTTPYCSENVKYVGIASGWGSSNTQWEFCSQGIESGGLADEGSQSSDPALDEFGMGRDYRGTVTEPTLQQILDLLDSLRNHNSANTKRFTEKV